MDQVTDAQTDALKKAGCERIFSEKRSGGNMRRPMLEQLLNSLQPSDVVVVYKLDRIARSLRDLLIIVDRIESADAEFRSLTEYIDTKSPTGRMIFQIVGAFAEFERELIRDRTRVGMEAAMLRGAVPGRPRGLSRDDELTMTRLWQSGQYSKTALGLKFGIHISSVKRVIARTQPALE